MAKRTSNAELLALQNEVLESVAIGEPLAATADLLCRLAGQMAPEAICSILLVDSENRLQTLAGPSLPAHYCSAINGLPIGPVVGSCGTAAFRGEAVEVQDIETDPLWDEFKGLALPLGLRACWSTPIWSAAGQVIGTFAFYFATPRGPDAIERGIVETCVHLCAIAIQHEQVQARNHHLARCDPLTGLLNRATFDTLVQERFSSGVRNFALLLLDIDHLKSINDTMGHAAGDALIHHVAQHLAAVGGKDPVCRIGGDEFAALLDQCSSPHVMRARAQRFLAAARTPLLWQGQTIVPRVTIGGAICGLDGTDGDTLRQNADFALYRAKHVRRGDFVRYYERLRTENTERVSTIKTVTEALLDNRIMAYFQPVVRLDSAEIVGLESLARMRTSDNRIIAAGAFQEAIADPAVAYQLTTTMITEVALAIRHWLDAGIPVQHVGINVSGADFLRGDLGARLTRVFDRHSVPLRHVVLEVTESVFLGGSDPVVERAIAGLREKGLLVALDDFGTGFASLTHLMRMPVDIIKIDKSFVDRMLQDNANLVVVRALIDIARDLKIRVIAEGIESAEQSDCLRDLGCNLGQGYHFARPVDLPTATRLLSSFGQGSPGARAIVEAHRSAG